jgi:predicted nucleotidyltransferase component of viral defense system
VIDREYLESLHFSGQEIQRTVLMENIARDISDNKKAGLVLKGGTALLLCYKLPRFSTDLDYDGISYDNDILKNIENGVKKSGLTVGEIITKKDTGTVKRFMLHCREYPFDPLKIEISFRNMDYLLNNKDCLAAVNGITVYTINRLAALKTKAFVNRTTARDVFDFAFLLKEYPDAVSSELIKSGYDKFKSAGMDFYENLMQTDKITQKFDCETILLKLNEQLEQKMAALQQQEPSRKRQGRHL